MIKVKSEKIIIFISGIFICGFVGWLFYDKLIFGIIISVPSYYLIKKLYAGHKQKKWKKEFERQFEDALSCLVSALQAGYSLENSLFEITKQLLLIYGKDGYILNELHVICRGLSVNIPVEKLINDMAVRTGVSAVSEFAEVLVIAKKSGGNLIDVTKQHVNILHEKRQVLNEIETVVSAKKCESIVMNIMPAGMIMYLRLTSGQFLEALYYGAVSRIVMTVLLFIYIAAIAIGKYITDFKYNGTVIKNMHATGNKRAKIRGKYETIIMSKIFSILKNTFLSDNIVNINNEIKALNINLTNETVINEFWYGLIKKVMLAIVASSVFLTYAMLRDTNNILFYIFISAVSIYAIPYSIVNSLKAKSEKRRSQMLLDYPELVDRLSLLIGAGLSIKGSFTKIAREYKAKRNKGVTGFHYLYEEIIYMVKQLDNGKSENDVYEEFGKRSGILCYMKLCTMLTQNLKKGGRDILDKLRITSLDALEERRNAMKTMGEKASSKLLFPMMLQFMIILVIIMYPAIVSM